MGPSSTENLSTNAQFDNDKSNKLIFTLFFYYLPTFVTHGSKPMT